MTSGDFGTSDHHAMGLESDDGARERCTSR